MKKRRGFIRYEFDDGATIDRPIPDDAPIPTAWFAADDGPDWIERYRSDHTQVEWYQTQDAMDELARSVRQRRMTEAATTAREPGKTRRILAEYRKRLNSNMDPRRIAAEVAVVCRCTTRHVRNTAKKAGLRK